MIKLVVFGVLFAAVVNNVNAAPSKVDVVNAAAEARRLVHQANWASVATISTVQGLEGYPIANILSTADSKIDTSSTGDIFFYLMDMDYVALDTKNNNKISFVFSDAQEGECNKRNDDPWSHKCPRAIIMGQVNRLEKNTPEYNNALEAFLSRHPTAAGWERMKVPNHEFYLCKLQIESVFVFSQRGYKPVTPAEYLAATDSVNA